VYSDMYKAQGSIEHSSSNDDFSHNETAFAKTQKIEALNMQLTQANLIKT